MGDIEREKEILARQWYEEQLRKRIDAMLEGTVPFPHEETLTQADLLYLETGEAKDFLGGLLQRRGLSETPFPPPPTDASVVLFRSTSDPISHKIRSRFIQVWVGFDGSSEVPGAVSGTLAISESGLEPQVIFDVTEAGPVFTASVADLSDFWRYFSDPEGNALLN